MKKEFINNTDLLVSNLCFGVADIGTKVSKKEDYAMLDAFVEAGGNFIDTARIYSDWLPQEKGRSERILGEWLKERNYSNDIFISTKGGHPSLTTMDIARLKKEDIEHDIKLSLRALGRDVLDLYYLHKDDESLPVEYIIEYLEEFKSRGYIRYYAMSNWSTTRIDDAQRYAKSKGYLGFSANEMYWNMATSNMNEPKDKSLVRMDEKMYNLHTTTKLCAMPYSSQAGGYFTKVIDNPDRAKNMIYQTAENEKRAKKLAERFSSAKTPMQYVLGYFFKRDFQVIPIFSASTMVQLKDTLYASENLLDTEIYL